MTWLPIDFKVPQYWKTAADGTNQYSGAVLKAYAVGTTTNINFATNNEGTNTVSSIALNADGFPEVSGNVVIPHLDQDYKLALYPSQSAADSDTGAVWTVDDIDLIQTTDTATAADYNVWPLVDYGGAYFDGTNDYLTRGADLTGNSDGKKGTIVAFVTFDTAPASAIEAIVKSTGGAFILRRDSDGVIRVIAENSGGSTILNMATSNAYETADTVYCIMASWDLATPGSNQLYVNDTSDVVTTTFTNDTIDYTVADWAIGATVGGGSYLKGNILSVWFDPTDNLDFDTETNRRKFLDEQSNPVYLGAEGQLPTGSQPIMFLGNYDDTRFETNRGSGGNFTENGAMATKTATFDGQFAGAMHEPDKVILTGLTLGHGNAKVTGLISGNFSSWNSGAIAADTTYTQSTPYAGGAAGKPVILGLPTTADTDFVYFAYATATNIVIGARNTTGSSATPSNLPYVFSYIVLDF